MKLVQPMWLEARMRVWAPLPRTGRLFPFEVVNAVGTSVRLKSPIPYIDGWHSIDDLRVDARDPHARQPDIYSLPPDGVMLIGTRRG